MKKFKNALCMCLIGVLLLSTVASCGKTQSAPQIPQEIESVKTDETSKDRPYGNAYRAYTMGQQTLKDFYNSYEDGGRGYNYYNKNASADSWNYISLIDMVENLLVLFPGDTKLYELYENAILGMEYFGSISYAGTKWENKVYCTQPASKKWRSTAVVSYDDSAHIARMFLDAYEKTGKEEYKTKGKNQIDFLIEDAYISNKNVEAFYWCDTSPIVAPVTNTMLIHDFLRMYSYLSVEEKNNSQDWIALSSEEIEEDYYITIDSAKENAHKYIYYAQKAFKWCQKLYDPATALYSLQTTATYENGSYEKGKETGTAGQHPVRDAHTGFMISACVALYQLTGDEYYLDKAVADTKGYFDYFFVTYDIGGETYYRPMMPNNWLLQKFVRGLYDLSQYRYDETKGYMNEISKTVNYAYDNSLVDNYINPFFVTGWLVNQPRCENYWLLDTSSAPTIFVYLRLWQKGVYHNLIESL